MYIYKEETGKEREKKTKVIKRIGILMITYFFNSQLVSTLGHCQKESF